MEDVLVVEDCVLFLKKLMMMMNVYAVIVKMNCCCSESVQNVHTHSLLHNESVFFLFYRVLCCVVGL